MSRDDAANPSPRAGLSLRTLVTVPFVTLVLASAVLMGWLGLTGGREAVRDVAGQLRAEVLARINQALRDYLAVPLDVNAFNVKALSRGLLRPGDPANVQRFFASIVEANPSIAYSFYSTADGEFYGARRLASGNVQVVRRGRDTGGDSLNFEVAPDGGAGALVQVYKQFDPCSRPWYKVAAKQHGPAWTGIYRHFALGVPTITASQPVYDEEGTLSGVFGVDYPLTRIHDFLRTIRFGRHGELYLLERSGDLLGASSVEVGDLMRPKEGGGYSRVSAASAGLPMLEAAVGHLRDLPGGLAGIAGPVMDRVQRGGVGYYVLAEPFIDGRGIDWLVVAVAPVSDFMGRIEVRSRETAVVGVIGLIAAIWAGMFMSRRIIMPVERLADAAEAISHGQWNQALPETHGRELHRLAATFGNMANQLRQAFDNLTRQHAVIAEHNRTLESRVDERTAELSDMHRRLRAIFDAIPGFVHVVDRNLRVVDAGDKLLKAMHLSRDEVIGRPCHEVFRGLGVVCDGCHLGDAPEMATGIEARPSTPEEEAAMGMPFMAYSAPILGADGLVWGFIECLMDVTLLRQTEKALAAAKEAAEEANRVKSDFLAKMSHDLRTPLNSIIGLTDIALQSRIPTDLRENLGIVLEAARSLLELVNDLLDLSRAEARGLTLREEHYGLVRLLGSVIRSYTPQARTKHLRLRLHPGRGCPAVIFGDPIRLRQVLANLVGNAVKFTEMGGVTLTAMPVEAPEASQAGTDTVWVRFTVSDTGPGIASEALTGIFEPFRQASREIGRKYGGTGLGLAICRQMVELMGGRISVTSSEGKGSDFSFVLPLLPGDAGQIAGHDRHPGRSLDALRLQQRAMRLLLAEDNPMNVTLARALLPRLGHELTVAGSGRQALECLRRERFDAVLMDVEMPEMDGLEATRRIRNGEAGEENRTIPVVAMTAHALFAFKEQCAEVGITAFVAKPVDFGELADVLRLVADGGGTCEEPEAEPLRRSEALARLNDDADLYASLCQVFQEESPAYRQRLQQALSASDYAALAQVAHSIKNGCGVIGADGCLLLAQELSTLAASQDMPRIVETVAAIERELTLVEASLAA